jgi:hypothetical protein
MTRYERGELKDLSTHTHTHTHTQGSVGAWYISFVCVCFDKMLVTFMDFSAMETDADCCKVLPVENLGMFFDAFSDNTDMDLSSKSSS